MFPINTIAVERWAKKLAEDAEFILHVHGALQQSWNNFALEATGDAFDKALTRGIGYSVDSVAYARLMKQASDTLYETVKAQLDLEAHYEHVKNAAIAEGLEIIDGVVHDKSQSFNPLVQLIQAKLDSFRVQAELLDKACHDEIIRLTYCTPQEKHEDLLPGGDDNLSLKNLDHIRRAEQQGVLAEIRRQHPDAKILKASDEGIIVSFGDLENADLITTMTFGVGSGEQENWPGHVSDAAKIHKDLPKNAAVIAWLDYKPPATIAEATDTMPAQLGATKLAEFQKFVHETNPAAYKTVLAHSYGTLPAVIPARRPDGLIANKIIMLGSPGGLFPTNPGGQPKDASTVLQNPDQELVVIDADRDPIGLLHDNESGIFGPDPKIYADESYRVSGGHSDFIGSEDNRKILIDEITEALAK
ncbi:alpha/beta hydrolase [Corynebacterium felinum]|uniref:DUF1023 domain-containing protein n=1 Tax=Corynebacterium felinum TaxID=131318 RepID=A0ABU2B5Q2_9CORY|nr:alpha/beta hydrolase [Corynebacterium felinum]MDF5820190.1 alpha/beta hydrolase [Corynebacterium felinum]MDR7353943.1 hypothetical protein [Corynebacterium felinum]WJY96116.1 hypothetical protein CFELI_12680 [Corynebacterium felinum]